MNRYLWRAFIAAAILSVATSAKSAMNSGRMGAPSGSFARSQPAPASGFRHPFFNHDHDFDHHHFFHNRSCFFFGFGFPAYYYAPYYYYYPPPYYYYGNSGPVSYYPSSSYSSGSYSAPADTRPYLVLGHDWAKDLRLDIVTWDTFVGYVKTNIANAPAGARDDFRRGFVSGYGENGDAAFAKALKDAEASMPNATPTQPADTSEGHY